ncbi:hypothetical protein [Fusobacterium sp. PH5-44]|uniref:hypothetical protein n=1 Tax=unclassified Fusobacterium TaxID=2648384 RepID=UPI003D2592E0
MKKLIKLSIVSIIILGSSLSFAAPKKHRATPSNKPIITKNHVLVKEYSYREGNKTIYVKEYSTKQQPRKHKPASPKKKNQYNRYKK